MSRIFVVHGPRPKKGSGELPDLGATEGFGQLADLFSPIDWPAMYPDRSKEILKQRLADFVEEDDYFLWCGGDPLALVLVGAYLHYAGINPRWLVGSRALDENGRRTTRYEYTMLPLPLDFDDGNGDSA